MGGIFETGVIIPILGILMTMIPVFGITLILTVRFAFKPLMESLTDAIREGAFGGGGRVESREEMLRLVEQVESLTDEVARLREASDFDRKLVGEAGRAAD